ncbi:prepilin-type N-terminal cleavage/methylation domain-containing protein [Elusimicrobium posterum]|uniref:type IV pilin protein n=1 Tax=Elusimicrobium posterum TaxID=3116653 RepID=UPI003C7086AB
MKKFKKGFTLIELLVVVVIIGILASVAVPQYQKAVSKSRASEIFITLKNIELAQQRYFMSNNEYTADLDDLDIGVPDITETNCAKDVGAFAQKSFENKHACYFLSSHANEFFTNHFVGFDVKGKKNVFMIVNGQKYCVAWTGAEARTACEEVFDGNFIRQINTNYIYEIP